MPDSSLRIIIVGGSLCGLFAGITLKRLGHQVQTLERNPTSILPARGAGIVSGPEIEGFFEKHGFDREIGVLNKLRTHLDQAGAVVHQQERLQMTTSWGLLYATLRRMFDGLEKVEKASDRAYRYGCEVTAFKEILDKKIQVSFRNEEGTLETLTAYLLIGADGANSMIRGVVLPSIKTKYVGYVAWRGTVSENTVSESVSRTCLETISFFFSEGMQMIVYPIPGEHGSLDLGNKFLNWVWYMNYDHTSPAYDELMTDADRVRHRVTVPAGKVGPTVWGKQKKFANDRLPPQFAELVGQTERPFVQSIVDAIITKNAFLDGRVLLVGDAVAAFRPHTGASTNQAALHAQKLGEYLQGSIDLEQWQKETMEYSRTMADMGIKLGDESQFGRQTNGTNGSAS